MLFSIDRDEHENQLNNWGDFKQQGGRAIKFWEGF